MSDDEKLAYQQALFGPMSARPGVRLTRTAAAVLDRYAAMLRPLKLTPARVLALAFVDSHAGCDQNALAGALNITKASAMALIDRLEGLKFVERRRGVNRRTNALHLTEHGQGVFLESLRVEEGLQQVLYGWMNDGQLTEFLEIIDRIARYASETTPATV